MLTLSTCEREEGERSGCVMGETERQRETERERERERREREREEGRR